MIGTQKCITEIFNTKQKEYYEGSSPFHPLQKLTVIKNVSTLCLITTIMVNFT